MTDLIFSQTSLFLLQLHYFENKNVTGKMKFEVHQRMDTGDFLCRQDTRHSIVIQMFPGCTQYMSQKLFNIQKLSTQLPRTLQGPYDALKKQKSLNLLHLARTPLNILKNATPKRIIGKQGWFFWFWVFLFCFEFMQLIKEGSYTLLCHCSRFISQI